MMLINLLVLGIIIPNAYGTCDDLLTSASTYTFGGTTYKKCSKLVNQHPIACKQAAVGGNGGLCCASCQALGDCYDALTKQSRLTLSTTVVNTGKTKNLKFKKCEDVLNDFPGLCKDEYDTDGTFQNYCCASCSSAPSTVDAPVLFKDGKKFIVCRDYVAKYPCDCSIPTVKSTCSASCASIDPVALDCCEDLLAKWNKVQVTYWGSLEKKIGIKDCSKLTKYPFNGLCLEDEFSDIAGYCCKTCSKIDTDCLDVLNTNAWDISGNSYDSCALLAKDQPCLCVDQAIIAEKCCYSCAKADLSQCECRDFSEWTFTFNTNGDNHCNLPTTPLTCEDIAANYPVLCNEYGGDGNPCCESCTGIDGNAQDDLTCFGRGPTDNRQWYTCSELVAYDPCECENQDVADSCPFSCSNADTSQCGCSDQPGWTFQFTIDENNYCNFPTSRLTCQEIVADYPVLCDEYGGDGNPCCESCTGIDASTQDDLQCFGRGPADNRDWYTCSELVVYDPCECNKPGVANHCPYSCSTADTSGCDCRDSSTFKWWFVFSSNPCNYPTNTFTCEDVNTYPIKCQESSDIREACCETCRDIGNGDQDDLTCFGRGRPSNIVYYRCAALIAKWPCECKKSHVANKCKLSCKNIDISDC